LLFCAFCALPRRGEMRRTMLRGSHRVNKLPSRRCLRLRAGFMIGNGTRLSQSARTGMIAA
jgi:hypothetical protein